MWPGPRPTSAPIKWCLDPSSRLATIDMNRKLGPNGLHTKLHLDMHPAVWHNDKSSAVAEMGDRGHNRHGPKREGGCAPFAGTPSSTM